MKKQKINIYGLLGVCVLTISALTGCGSKASENQDAYRQIGINDMEEGNYEDAVDAFQKALNQSLAVIGEKEIDICYYKAQAQYASGDIDGALDTYSALVNYDKKNADAFYLRGSLYLLEGEKEKAVADFESAVKAEDENYDLYIQIYSDLKDVGYEEEGITYLEKAVDISGKSDTDYTMRGKAYILLGDYDAAVEQLDKAIAGGSTDATLYRAQVYELQGDGDKAQSLYETYVENNSDNSLALGSLGSMLLEEGKYTEALNYIQMALSLDNVENEQELRKNEILAYEYTYDFASAKSAMESYVADYPEDTDAQREYLLLQTR